MSSRSRRLARVMVLISEMASLLDSTNLRLAAGVVPAAPCSEMASTNFAAESRAAMAAADAAEDDVVDAPWSTPDKVLPWYGPFMTTPLIIWDPVLSAPNEI